MNTLADSAIVLPNVHEYVYRGIDSTFSENMLAMWREMGAAYSEVGLFWEGDDKVVVAPRPINQQFVEYVSDLLGYKRLSVLCPRRYTSELSMDLLGDEAALSYLIDHAKGKDAVYLVPWGATQPVYSLLARLRQEINTLVSEELPDRNCYWTSVHFDSKIGFRGLCDKLNCTDARVRMPRGFSCGSFQEALEVLRWFHSSGTPCVVKAGSGVGGYGNIFIDREKLGWTFHDVMAHIMANVEEMPYFASGAAVVEEMVITDHRMQRGGGTSSSAFASAVILPSGEMRMVGGGIDIRDRQCYYVGAEVGKDTLFDSLRDTIEPFMYRIGEAVSLAGYRGHFGINFMISSEGTLYAIELNARRCGESHVYALAKRLYGDEWEHNCCVLTRLPYRIQACPDVTVSSVLRAFERVNFRSRQNGVLVVPTEVGWLHQRYPGIGYAIFGASRDVVNRAESSLKDYLAQEGILGQGE